MLWIRNRLKRNKTLKKAIEGNLFPQLSKNSSMPSIKNYAIEAERRPKTMAVKQRKKRFSSQVMDRLSQPKYKPITEDDLANKGKSISTLVF